MKYKSNSHELEAFGRTISVSCDVRNEVDGRRHADQVVYSMPENKPYQPRQFPKGVWNVGRPVARNDPYKRPWFIPTDAFRVVNVWELKDGKYAHITDEVTTDVGYGLHYSESGNTLGCLKITNESDLLWLVDQICKSLDKGEKITLEVS